MLGTVVRILQDGLGLRLRIVTADSEFLRIQLVRTLPHAVGIGLAGMLSHSSTVPGIAEPALAEKPNLAWLRSRTWRG